jgi:hypothetical protein
MEEKKSFAEEFVLKVLEENGVKDLTKEQENIYVPEFMLRIHRRMGDRFVAQLEDNHIERLNILLDDEKVTSDDWFNFWSVSVENFDEQFEDVLMDFRRDIAIALA